MSRRGSHPMINGIVSYKSPEVEDNKLDEGFYRNPICAEPSGEGYATTSTDAVLTDNLNPASWALERFGNVDFISIHNLGS